MITDKLKPIGATSTKETVRVSGIVKSASSPGGGTGETDPTVPDHVKAITEEQIEAWDTMSGSGYAPVVHVQSSPSTIWVAANPFGRPCAVELIDAAGNEFEATVTHDVPTYTTVTVTLNFPASGRMILV